MESVPQASPSSSPESSDDVVGSPQSRGNFPLSAVTRDVIAAVSRQEFDSVELRRLIEPHWGPMNSATQRANLANLLRRMVERGELELVEQGTGSRPSRYRKKVKNVQTVGSPG